MTDKISQYIIKWYHSEPGCGCGCEDNDLNIGEQRFEEIFYFRGTLEEAKKFMGNLEKSVCPSYGNNWTLSEHL